MRKKIIQIKESDVECISTSIHIKKLEEGTKELDYIIGMFYDTFNTWSWIIDIYEADYLGYFCISTKYIYGSDAGIKIGRLVDKINELLAEYHKSNLKSIR